jgi:UDP-N-acetylglucosamine diphosphorylase/glucosamine-1-phosphate N-acetyltransferase
MAQDKNYKLAVVILAAGMGKRMKDPSKAKVMALIDDKPLIGHVLDKIQNLDISKIIVIVGHKKEDAIDYLNDFNKDIVCVEQKEQLGTGHAVEQTRELFNDYNGSILILCGDVPNLSSGTLNTFIENHFNNNSDISVLTTLAPNPFGYGRIIRNEEGEFIRIVEQKDANEVEKEVNEINSGVYLVNSGLLFDSLKGISNNNAQGEYYLTDIVAIFKKSKANVKAFPIAEFDELLGVNSIEDLEKARKFYFTKYKN